MNVLPTSIYRFTSHCHGCTIVTKSHNYRAHFCRVCLFRRCFWSVFVAPGPSWDTSYGSVNKK